MTWSHLFNLFVPQFYMYGIFMEDVPSLVPEKIRCKMNIYWMKIDITCLNVKRPWISLTVLFDLKIYPELQLTFPFSIWLQGKDDYNSPRIISHVLALCSVYSHIFKALPYQISYTVLTIIVCFSFNPRTCFIFLL